MAFGLLETAQLPWRRLNGAALLPLLRAGAPFKDGVKIERYDQQVVETGAEVARLIIPIHQLLTIPRPGGRLPCVREPRLRQVP